jgi:hypothetical protein
MWMVAMASDPVSSALLAAPTTTSEIRSGGGRVVAVRAGRTPANRRCSPPL